MRGFTFVITLSLLILVAVVLASAPHQNIAAGLDPVRFLKQTVTHDLPAYLKDLPIPDSASDISKLSLDDYWRLLPIVIAIFSPIIVTQFLKKVREASDLENNSTGWFAFSKFFYKGNAISALPFVLGFVPGSLALLSAHWAEYGNWSWVMFVAGYVLVPIADLFIGEDSYNPTDEEENRLKRNTWFRVVMWLYTPSYIATVVYGAHVIATKPELTTWQWWGISTSVGIAGGFGIGCVHEMIHRPSIIELGCGIVALIFANYSHFWIEHLWGHHKRVATDEDPASSNLGDDVYTFIIKDMYQSFVDALDLERRFLEKKKRSFLWNRIFQGYVCSAIIGYAFYHYYGLSAFYFYLAQGIITAIHIENANYIEHYGLRRRKIEGKFDKDGEPVYESPGWFHAWDTADRLTNWILFKIQRHPDHHTNAGRPYQILRTLPQSPHMPTGYAGMFVLSWFPPLFWAVMDPLVENAYRQRRKMEAKGIAASAFPRGSNNISSFFKREGEGFFEPGSSPYNAKDFYGGSDATKKSDVWDVSYNEEFSKGKHSGQVVESGQIAKFKAAEISLTSSKED